jgi:hypothetical protein
MTSEQQQIAALEAEFREHQIWVVHRYIGGPVWCARRHDGVGTSINADSADQLRAYLKEQADGRP